MNYKTGFWESPIGTIKIISSEKGLVSVKFLSENDNNGDEHCETSVILESTKAQLEEYFAKKRTVFELPFDLTGTEFQQHVWNEVVKIPYGTAITYTNIAKRLGSDRLVRAAGTANGKNPLWIIIPCHRVVGVNGKLVGYAGGLWRKQWLLEHENQNKKIL